MRIETYPRGPFATNTYVVLEEDRDRGYVVDPTFDTEDVARDLQGRGVEIVAVINTHGHLDHVAGNRLFCETFDAPLWAHSGDLAMIQQMEAQARMFGLEVEPGPEPDRLLEESDRIEVGEEAFEVLCTPGHSPGGICLVAPGVVIAGDALFAGSIGRTDLWQGDFATLRDSIHDKLFTLPDDTRVLPGHGPETTIGREKRNNPFVGEAAGPIGG